MREASWHWEAVEALEWINEVVRNDSEAQFDLSFVPDKPGLVARGIISACDEGSSLRDVERSDWRCLGPVGQQSSARGGQEEVYG